MPPRGLARKADGTPTRKSQRNFTDPESQLMQSGGSYLQGYNCQVAVDSDHQVIVAIGVSNQPPDVEHLKPMLERIAASAGALLPDVNYVGGSRQLRRRVGPPPPCHGRGVGRADGHGRLAGN